MALIPADQARGAATFGGGVVKFNAFAEVMSDSNVFGDTTDESDLVFTARPQLVYDREGSVGTSHLDAGVAFERFSDFSGLNSENWTVNGAIDVPENSAGRLTGGVKLGYFNGAQADSFLGQRADVERLNLNVDASYLVSGRTSLRFGFTRQSYDTEIRPGSDSTSFRAGVSLELRQALRGFLDFTRSSTNTDAAPGSPTAVDFTTNDLTAGLEGQINAVWSGSISAGFQNLSASSDDAGGDDEGFVATVNLNWALRQNTTIGFAGGRNIRITPNADAIEATTASVNVSQQIGAALTATASLLWETFETRGLGTAKDDRVAANLDLAYSISDRFGWGGGITHNVRYSVNPARDISRTTYTVFGRITF